MEIKFQLKDGKVLSICFGRITKWFECVDWFHITIEEYDDPEKPMQITYAWYKLGLFREKNAKKLIGELK